MTDLNLSGRLKTVLIGKSRDLSDKGIFHQLSLIAFFAWVGLGADGLSSSCYGPEEAFKALNGHIYLSLLVAAASVVTVFVISASYSQIIELFPTGGGGYLVASKLLSPRAGVVSGSALLIDYVLTITLSVASGADALFSLLPASGLHYKLTVEIAGVCLLTLLNLRGAKEAVLPWVPIFIMFVLTHAFVIGYTLCTHLANIGEVWHNASTDMAATHSQLGWLGMILLVLRAYSMGAGTYTGIEAVSNGLPILREPRVQTGKRTMHYMAVSLSLTVAGLLVAYLLFRVTPQEGKTLNAVLFEQLTASWPHGLALAFILVTLASEAALLFVAAQTGFLDGPRVLANMALDRWFPTRFATLSDRFVTHNGILLMGGCSLLLMAASRGSVDFLVVLYSINVFITFSLSQLGMVRHWWAKRGEVADWKRKISVNGVGFLLTTFILITLSVVKFFEGGWITLVVTGLLVAAAVLIKRHYNQTALDLRHLDELAAVVDMDKARRSPPGERTASRRPNWTPKPRPPSCWSTASTAWGCTRFSRCCACSRGSFAISCLCKSAWWMPAISRAPTKSRTSSAISRAATSVTSITCSRGAVGRSRGRSRHRCGAKGLLSWRRRSCSGSPTRSSSAASSSFATRRSSPGSCTTTRYSPCSGASTSRASRC